MKKLILMVILLLAVNLYATDDKEFSFKNYKGVKELLIKSCNSENMYGCFALGQMYHNGDAVAKNGVNRTPMPIEFGH